MALRTTDADASREAQLLADPCLRRLEECQKEHRLVECKGQRTKDKEQKKRNKAEGVASEPSTLNPWPSAVLALLQGRQLLFDAATGGFFGALATGGSDRTHEATGRSEHVNAGWHRRRAKRLRCHDLEEFVVRARPTRAHVWGHLDVNRRIPPEPFFPLADLVDASSKDRSPATITSDDCGPQGTSGRQSAAYAREGNTWQILRVCGNDGGSGHDEDERSLSHHRTPGRSHACSSMNSHLFDQHITVEIGLPGMSRCGLLPVSTAQVM